MIKKFIEDNKLDFTGSGSELNSNCLILSGFACYKKLELNSLLKEVDELGFSSDAYKMVETTFRYAEKKNYGEAWESGKYKGKYIY